jgi:hypothetical protein
VVGWPPMRLSVDTEAMKQHLSPYISLCCSIIYCLPRSRFVHAAAIECPEYPAILMKPARPLPLLKCFWTHPAYAHMQHCRQQNVASC